jgi:hypothetical protein
LSSLLPTLSKRLANTAKNPPKRSCNGTSDPANQAIDSQKGQNGIDGGYYTTCQRPCKVDRRKSRFSHFFDEIEKGFCCRKQTANQIDSGADTINNCHNGTETGNKLGCQIYRQPGHGRDTDRRKHARQVFHKKARQVYGQCCQHFHPVGRKIHEWFQKGDLPEYPFLECFLEGLPEVIFDTLLGLFQGI